MLHEGVLVTLLMLSSFLRLGMILDLPTCRHPEFAVILSYVEGGGKFVSAIAEGLSRSPVSTRLNMTSALDGDASGSS